MDSHLSTLRPSRRESERLVAVLLASLILHLLFWGGYEAGRKYGWWDRLHLPAWLHRAPKLVAQPVQPQAQREEPLEFVSVDDPSTVAPKNAKFYSSQNSQAADQSNERDTDKPKLEGRQTDVVRLNDALRPQVTEPKPPEPKQPSEDKTVQKAQEAGDLTVGKPQPEQPPARPRTLAEALAQQKQTPGQKSRLDAGAMRHAIRSSLNAIGTPWGAYDEAIVEAVTQYWYDELDSQKFALDRSGKVVIQFKLNEDGTVTEVQELQNSVGFELGLVCQDAITGPAPFAKWPPGMSRDFGRNFRVITFTFDYY